MISQFMIRKLDGFVKKGFWDLKVTKERKVTRRKKLKNSKRKVFYSKENNI